MILGTNSIFFDCHAYPILLLYEILHSFEGPVFKLRGP